MYSALKRYQNCLISLDLGYYNQFKAYVLIHTLLDSFGRISEVLAIQKSDIDFEQQCITFTKTKNKKIRIVPISKKTAKLLTELIAENEEEWDTDYVFLTHHGKPLTSLTWRKHLKEITDKAGIKRRVHSHGFRHAASEIFLRQNGSIRVLQKILGHQSLEITQRYSHVLDDTLKTQHAQFSPINLLENQDKRKTKRTT